MIGCTRILETEVGLFLLNTEFFFDPVEPHENEVSTSIDIPTSAEYQAETKSIANLIGRYQANLVALAEVENREYVELVRNNLNQKKSWRVFFQEGRNTYTGQNVAVLSKFPVAENSITNFPDQWSNYTHQGKNKSIRLSKVLGCKLDIHGQSVYLIVVHLISKKTNNNAARLGQASALHKQSLGTLKSRHVILMDDFNDISDTPVLQKLRGLSNKQADLIQTSRWGFAS